MTAPLVITRDETLLDELLRLAAAAGVTPEVAPDGVAALRGWSAAPLVLVGADVAAELAGLRPAATRGVHVVACGDGRRRRRSRTALALGAENGRRPAGSERLAGRAAHRRRRRAGRRAGRRSAWSAARAAPAPRRSPARSARSRPGPGTAVVVDADPLGPGVDRVLGLDSTDGVRWDELVPHDRPAGRPRRCARRCRGATARRR